MSKRSAPDRAKRKWLVPEVIQTSEMDCGPAALKCLLEGHRIPASYGRLREACQTGVDGTSIDTLEEIALALGLDASQTLLPPDHVLLPEAAFFPCIAVVQAGLGLTHFVVAWRRVGPWVQVSDPSSGRQWIPAGRFVESLYLHEQTFSQADYREWASGDINGKLLVDRMRELEVDVRPRTDAGWQDYAALDAGLRVVRRLVEAKALAKGAEAQKVLENLLANPETIPESAWAISDAGDEENVVFAGAVFVHIAGLKETGELTPELAAALHEAPARPWRELVRMVPWAAASALALAALLTAAAVLLQGYLWNAFDRQRLLWVVALVLLLQVAQAFGWLALGRRLEIAFRRRFLRKIPKLGDAYFRSRPRSDMADRSHALYRLRNLPPFVGRMLRTSAELLLTAAGILWLAPGAAFPVLLLLGVAFGLPWILKPLVMEQDLRLRIQFGAMTRYYLDALLGLFAIRAHGATRLIRRAHAELTDEWAATAFAYQKTLIAAEGVQMLVSFALAVWIVRASAIGAAERALLFYWTLTLPGLASALLQTIWQYPSHRNVALRALEPLGALEDQNSGETGGREIVLEGVCVRVAGHTLLADVNLRIAAGEKVAIVGHSGAGKSSLAGLLLGWTKPSQGRLLLPADVAVLRQQTAWVDPEVHLWDASCLENIAYGNPGDVQDAYEAAELEGVIGLEQPLGPQGARLSGGQGQRVRFARAWMRRDAQLVILDEAFRGLDSATRARLQHKARERWPLATMLMITHDTVAAAALDRVVVMEGGRVVEDGAPRDLLAKPGSKFRELREIEERNAHAFDGWRELVLRDGELREVRRR